MTRKRFIKLAMSHGYSKREAVRIAAGVDCPYEEYYGFYRPYMALKTSGGACRRVGRALTVAFADAVAVASRRPADQTK